MNRRNRKKRGKARADHAAILRIEKLTATLREIAAIEHSYQAARLARDAINS